MPALFPAKSRRGRLRTKLAISLVSLIVFIGGGELVARLCGVEPQQSTTAPLWMGDADLHWRYQPNQDLFTEREGRSYTAHINNHGHRGPDYPLVKPAGEFRIIGLGDSMAFGPGVNDDETFYARLQQGYDKTLSPVGRPFVINTGVNSYSAVHYRRFCETRLEEFDPDLIVVGLYTGNDNVITPTAKTVIPVPWQPLLRKSALAVAWDTFYREWAWKRIQAAKQDKSFEQVEQELLEYRGVEPQHMDPEAIRVTWMHAFEHVEAMQAACDAHGVSMVVLLIPNAPVTVKPVDDELFAWQRGELEQRGILVIDPLPLLRPVHKDAWLPYDSGHFDREGHRAVAIALFKGLKNLGLVPLD